MNIEMRGIRIGKDWAGGWVTSTKESDSTRGLDKDGSIISIESLGMSLGFVYSSVWYR